MHIVFLSKNAAMNLIQVEINTFVASQHKSIQLYQNKSTTKADVLTHSLLLA